MMIKFKNKGKVKDNSQINKNSRNSKIMIQNKSNIKVQNNKIILVMSTNSMKAKIMNNL